MLPSGRQIELARTENGGWKKKQLAEWGISWPPEKGWKRGLEKRYERLMHEKPIGISLEQYIEEIE